MALRAIAASYGGLGSELHGRRVPRGSRPWDHSRICVPRVMSASSSGSLALYGALALVYLGLAADFYLTYRLSGDVDALRRLTVVTRGDAVAERIAPSAARVKRRARHRRGGNDDDAEDGNVPSVEFFPKPQQGPGVAHDGEGYVWLTSYSRIPVSTRLFGRLLARLLLLRKHAVPERFSFDGHGDARSKYVRESSGTWSNYFRCV